MSGFILRSPLSGTFKSCREFPLATAGEKLFLPTPWGTGAKLAAFHSWKKKQPLEQMAGSKEWCWKQSFKAIQFKNHNSTQLSSEIPATWEILNILPEKFLILKKKNTYKHLLLLKAIHQYRLVLGYHQQRCNRKRQPQHQHIFPSVWISTEADRLIFSNDMKLVARKCSLEITLREPILPQDWKYHILLAGYSSL